MGMAAQYLRLFCSDVVIVKRGAKIERVFVNCPGARVVLLDLGGPNEPPVMRSLREDEVLFDVFGIEAYVKEFLGKARRFGADGKLAENMETVCLRIERFLDSNPKIKEVGVDGDGNISVEGEYGQ